MRYLHTAFRVADLDAALAFYTSTLGFKVVKRFEGIKRNCSIAFLAAPGDERAQIEIVYYHDPEERAARVGFSHVAYEVDDIYAACRDFMSKGAIIAMPPRDGAMAFVKSSDGMSFELFNKGGPKPTQEPWASMPDQADW
ncbi:MAG: lactoylglutathione lyase [Alphaproteobacteria bacterium]|nr:lactoylglutathione lyase [Alphaproteobacteria bacterium]